MFTGLPFSTVPELPDGGHAALFLVVTIVILHC